MCSCPVPAANDLAERLVGEQLAATVQLIEGVRSYYWHEGEIGRDRETLLLITTDENLSEKLRERLAELHPYEVPPIVALQHDAAASLASYMGAVGKALASGQSDA